MPIEDSIKRIMDKLENDAELRKLAVLMDTHPEYKNEILTGWVNKMMEMPVGVQHLYVNIISPDTLEEHETFRGIEELFNTFPNMRRFEKDML